MADNESLPPLYRASSDNHAAWVVATSLIFIIYSVAAVIAKIVIRLNSSSMKSHNFMIIAGTSVGLVQTVCIISACSYGLGRHTDRLDEESFELYSKYFHAAQVLYIASIAFIKASLCLLIAALTPQFSVLLAIRMLLGLIALWAVSGMIALGLQCDLPNPWLAAPGKCVNQQALHIFNGVMNIVTDLILVSLPIFIVRKVQVSSSKRWQVLGLFGNRIIVPIVTILSLALSQSYFDSLDSDPTWSAVNSTISSQVGLNLSILTACIPSLKVLLHSLFSNTSGIAIHAPYEVTAGGLNSHEISASRAKAKGTGRSGGASASQSPFGTKKSRSSTANKTGSHNDNKPARSDSQKSLTDDVIVRTEDYELEFEDHNRAKTSSQYGYSQASGEDEISVR